jgi:hypothetical protein
MSAAWKLGLGAFIALRTLATSAALFANWSLEIGETLSVGAYVAPRGGALYEAVVGTWVRADALWYLNIAENGYTTTADLAFFPLFPGLIKLVSFVIPNEVIASIVVSNFACLLGFVVLFKLVEDLGGREAGRAAVIGLAAFPTAFFLIAPYAESTLLVAGAGALWAAREQKAPLAAVLGAAAVLARPFGVLIAIPLLFMLRKSDRWAMTGPALAVSAWVAWGWFITGRMAGIVEVQRIWQRQLAFPFATLWSSLTETLRYRLSDLFPYFLFDVITWLAGAALVVATYFLLRRKVSRGTDLSLLAYGVGVLLLPASYPFPPRPLLSFPRFVLALFPAFGGYALVPERTRVAIWAISATIGFWAAAMFVAARPIF